MKAALDELRAELGDERVPLPELVILGAEAKLAQLRSERESVQDKRRWLADRVRAGDLEIDVEAADKVRRTGWMDR